MTTQTHPRLLLEPPPGFVGLPFEQSEQDNTRNMRELAGRIAGPAGLDQDTMAGHLTVLATVMAVNKVQLFGKFAVSIMDNERPAVASLAMTMLPMAAPSEKSATTARDRKATAAELLKRHRKRVPHAEAHVVELPIGPAMIAATAGVYRLPPEVTHRPNPVVLPEFKAEFQIPAPDSVHLIVLTVTTGDEAAWPEVAAAAMRVATSLRFESPEE